MTDKERREIEKNSDNINHIDYCTATVIESIIDLESMLAAQQFANSLKTASPAELNTFVKSIGYLHSTMSELYEKSGGAKLSGKTEMQIMQRFNVIFDYVAKQRDSKTTGAT